MIAYIKFNIISVQEIYSGILFQGSWSNLTYSPFLKTLPKSGFQKGFKKWALYVVLKVLLVIGFEFFSYLT